MGLRVRSRALLAGASIQPPARAEQARGDSDRQRLALFVYNLVRFLEWPPETFDGASTPVRVTVLGADPFDGWLDRLLVNKTVRGRRFAVSHADRQGSGPSPHVAFVAASLEGHFRAILAGYCRAPVLTISTMPRFANRLGAIELVEQDAGIRFAVNRIAIGEARVVVGAQLLHLAVPLFSAVSPCPIHMGPAGMR